jgi:hypothetical protein
MPNITLQGRAAVFKNDQRITDAAVLRTLAGVRYDDERFTDYLGGPPEEDALAHALEPGGTLTFDYVEGEDSLTAITQYRARRDLASAELSLLVDYTMGQWSDGIGENWTCESASRYGYAIMCLTPGDVDLPTPYPLVQISHKENAK